MPRVEISKNLWMSTTLFNSNPDATVAFPSASTMYFEPSSLSFRNCFSLLWPVELFYDCVKAVHNNNSSTTPAQAMKRIGIEATGGEVRDP